MTKTRLTDFLIVDHGSIWTFTPMTDAAKAHCEAHFPDDCQTFGRGYVVEPRYATDIIDDLVAEDFELAY